MKKLFFLDTQKFKFFAKVFQKAAENTKNNRFQKPDLQKKGLQVKKVQQTLFFNATRLGYIKARVPKRI